MIRADEPDAGGGAPSSPWQGMLAAALIIAVALVGISLGHHEDARNAAHHGVRDPAIHRYAPDIVVRQPIDNVPDEADCPEPEPPLLC